MTSLLVTQPTPFPHVHLLARAFTVDHLVLMGSAQFTRKTQSAGGTFSTRQNSYRLIGPSGPLELTIPVRKARASIDSTALVDAGWIEKHLRSIEHSYRRAPFFGTVFDDVSTLLYSAVFASTIGQVSRGSWLWALARLGGGPAVNRDDELVTYAPDLDPPSGNDRIADLCRATGADVYVAGPTALDHYLDHARFSGLGIELRPHTYSPAPWPQRAKGFEPDVSILDLAFNLGWEAARRRLIFRSVGATASPDPDPGH